MNQQTTTPNIMNTCDFDVEELIAEHLVKNARLRDCEIMSVIYEKSFDSDTMGLCQDTFTGAVILRERFFAEPTSRTFRFHVLSFLVSPKEPGHIAMYWGSYDLMLDAARKVFKAKLAVL